MVGLGRVELPTSPLSGVRSSHLSYRPGKTQRSPKELCVTSTYNQVWWSWSGSNRRPPECKSGALPAELQPPKIYSRPIGRKDHEDQLRGHDIKTSENQVEIRCGLSLAPSDDRVLGGWSGTAASVYVIADSTHVLS